MKVKCVSIETFETTYQKKPTIGATIKFNFVYHNNDPNHENTKYWEATPGGTFQVTISNHQAMEQIQVSKEYYLDLIPA